MQKQNNYIGVTEEVRWVRLHYLREKKLPFLKEYKNRIFHFVERNFNFCPAIEKC